MYTYAYHWSTKLHTTLKFIYDRLNENDQSAQILKDKALVEKEASPPIRKRDSHGLQLKKDQTGPSRPYVSSPIESRNSPKRIRISGTSTSSRTHSIPLHNPYQPFAQGMHLLMRLFTPFFISKT